MSGRLQAALLALGLALAAPAGAQERGPIRLFPGPSERSDQPARGPGAERPPARVEVESLLALDVASVDVEGAFAGPVWAGSDPKFLVRLFDDLPRAPAIPSLRRLGTRLLATGVDLEGASGQVLEARGRGLLVRGEPARAHALLSRLPPSDRDGALLRGAADAALWIGADAAACARASEVAPTTDAAFWGRISVFCRLQQEDPDGARLALTLLRDQDEPGEGFFRLVEVVAAGDDDLPLPLPAILDPGAVEIALVRLAERRLPESSLLTPSPPLVAAIVATPDLAPDPGQAPEAVLRLHERAFVEGTIDLETLRARYADAIAEVPEDVVPEALLRQGERATARALVAMAADDGGLVTERAARLARLWRSAPADEKLVVGRVFASQVGALPINPGLRSAAPAFVRLLLAGDRPLEAARWFSVLRIAENDPRSQREVGRLNPLLALVGVGGAERVPVADLATLEAWRQTHAAADRDLPFLLALLEGTGVPVDDAIWWSLMDQPLDEGSRPLPMASLLALEQAMRGGRAGEGLALALALIGEDPETAHPLALIRALEAIRTLRPGGRGERLVREPEIRRLALEAALVAGF